MAFNKEDCHGIYLIFYNSIKENIKSKDELLTILRESGRNVGSDLISKYWKSREINYEEYIKICQEVPIITKTDLIKALKMMDTNKYGYLEKSEFIRTMSTPESPLSRKDILEIIKRIDVKDDGKLQFEVVADLLLSNLESFKKLGRSKIAEKEGKSPTKSVQEVAQHRKSQSNSNRNSLSITEEDEDEDDIVLSSRKSSDRKSENEIHIEKITSARFEYTEPKTLKNWRKTILRGCLFLGEISSSNSVQDPNIESHLYKFTVNTATNVFIMMSPLTILQKLDLREVPDLGFVILNKSEEIVALSMPADASGAVYFSGNLNPGSYNVLPFTTGAKLKSKANEAKDNFSNLRPLKKDSNGDYEFSNEVKTMLEDIFKICDIDGNGYLNKEEFIWYSTKTSEDDWEEDMWTELKSRVKLHNGELSFTNFTDLIMEEIMQENGDPAPLLLTLDLFGFNEKCMIEEAFPFSMTFYVENSDYLAKCFGIHNKTILVESSLKNFVVTQGEKLSGKVNWKDCNVYMSCRNGRILVAVENTNPASKQIPVRLTINMEKSKNLAVYKDKFQRNVSIDTGTKLLAVHGVPIEPKVPISCDCFIRRS